jgi:hypothetical protein
MKKYWKLITVFLIIWFGLGFLTYGWSFAYWQGKFPRLAEEDYTIDRNNALLNIPGGACAFIGWVIHTWTRGCTPWEYGFKLA